MFWTVFVACFAAIALQRLFANVYRVFSESSTLRPRPTPWEIADKLGEIEKKLDKLAHGLEAESNP